ncbi:hypothetical protein LOAG_16092, partial [Loa loa]
YRYTWLATPIKISIYIRDPLPIAYRSGWMNSMRFKKFYATVSELARNYSHQNAFHLLHRLPHPTELHSNHRFKPLAQFEIDDFIKFEEPQTEPLDLSMSRTYMGIHKFVELQT